MPDVFIEIPVLTNRWTTGLAFQVHLVFVAAIMGASILAPTAQIIGWRRPNSYFPRLARDTATVMVRFFAFGATWAVVAIVVSAPGLVRAQKEIPVSGSTGCGRPRPPRRR